MLYTLFVEKSKIKLASWFFLRPPPPFWSKANFFIFFNTSLTVVNLSVPLLPES